MTNRINGEGSNGHDVEAVLHFECCGRVRTSRFCPECGRQLGRHAGEELLAHVRVQLDKARTLLEDDRRWIADPRCFKPSAQRRIDLSELRLAKWERFNAWLESVLEA